MSPGDVYNPAGIMLANLRALFAVVVDIVLLRRGPEHLPASPMLLAILVAAYVAITGLVYHLTSTPDPRWPMVVTLVVVVTMLWYRVALQLVGKSERFTQTLTALFALRVLFTPLDLPIRITLYSQIQAGVEPSNALALVFLVQLVWLFVLNVRIVRSAFEWQWPAAIIMVLAYEFAVLLAAAALFGRAASAAA
jgi:hypothetical protein